MIKIIKVQINHQKNQIKQFSLIIYLKRKLNLIQNIVLKNNLNYLIKINFFTYIFILIVKINKFYFFNFTYIFLI